MMNYNYREAVAADILDYIRDNYTAEEIRANLEDFRFRWEEELRDDLWVCDSVTGNASGSYYCNTYRAAEALAYNWDLLRDALYEFGCDDVNPIDKGEEWCDVTIRCYLLSECLAEVLDDLEEEIDREQEEEA